MSHKVSKVMIGKRAGELAFLARVYVSGLALRRKLRRRHGGKIMVYLSGNIDGLSYAKALNWRQKIPEMLGENFVCLEFPGLIGQDKEKYLSPAHEKRSALRRTDLELLIAADIILMQLNDGKLTVGTIKEDHYAFWFRRPVVIWSSLRKIKESSWIDSTTAIFDTLSGAVNFILKECATRNGIEMFMRGNTSISSHNQRSIVVSGYASSGKSTLAKKLSEHLGLPFRDGGDALKELALLDGFKIGGKDWWDTEDGLAFLTLRESDPHFDHNVDEILRRYADEGSVITSWTLPWIHEGPIKVWLDTSTKERINRLAGRDSIEKDEATRVIKKRDKKNLNHYRKLYNFEFGADLSPFHIHLRGDGTKDEIFNECLEKISELEKVGQK